MKLWLAGVAGAILASGPVGAAPFELGGTSVEAPRKWTAGEGNQNSMLWQRSFPESSDERAGAALIQLLVVGNDGTALVQGLASMIGTIGEMKDEDPITDDTGINGVGHEMIVQFRCCGEMEDVGADLYSVAIGAPDRRAYLQMVMLNLDDERQKAAEADFAEMVRSFRLRPDDTAFEIVPQPGDGGLDGVFTYLRTGLMPNVFGGLDFTSDSEVRLYSPDGLFTTQLPAGGVDLAAHCRTVPDRCGTYRVSGGGWFGGPGQIELRSVADEFGRFEIETLPFNKKGDDIVIDDEEHRRLKPFAPETRFDGEWRYFFASSGAMASSSGSVAVERVLRFTPDGRFERSGWSGASSTTDGGSGITGVTTSSDRPATAGTYRIEGHSLTLTGAGADTETLSIFAPEAGSDALLVIDGDNYLKED